MSAAAGFGPYEVVRPLGRGAMGEVYLARHRELGAEHAVKVLSAELVLDEESHARFARELEVLARVDLHPGIVRIHGAGRTPDGRPWYSMEFVEGRTLGQALKQGLPPAEGLAVIAQLCGALAYAHGQGLVHRDVKPDNVMLSDDGRVRLLDFGLARATQREGARLTRTGDLLGTPAYMAPEQAKGDREATPAADVFALGAILHELFAGTPPYTAPTAIGVFEKLISGEPPPPLPDHPDLTPRLRAVIARALAHDPSERYPDAAALQQALQDEPEEAAPLPRELLLLGGVALLLVALTAVLVTFVVTSRSSPSASAAASPTSPALPTVAAPSPSARSPEAEARREQADGLLRQAEQTAPDRPAEAAALYAQAAALEVPELQERATRGARQAVLRAQHGLLAVLPGEVDELRDCAWAPDGRTVYAIAYSGQLLAWSLPDGERRVLARLGDQSRELALDPQGTTLAVSQAHSIHVLSLPDAKLLTTLTGHEHAIRAMALGENFLISASDDGTLRVWPHAKPPGRVLGEHADRVYGCALEPTQGRRAVSAGREGVLRAYDLVALDTVEVALGVKLRGCAFLPDGKLVAAVDAQGDVWLWDLTRDRPRNVGQCGHDLQAVTAVQGGLLATADDEGRIQLWDPRQGVPVHEWRGHDEEAISALEASPRGGLLASCGEDGTVHVWVVDDEHDPEMLPVIPGFEADPVNAVDLALDDD